MQGGVPVFDSGLRTKLQPWYVCMGAQTTLQLVKEPLCNINSHYSSACHKYPMLNTTGTSIDTNCAVPCSGQSPPQTFNWKTMILWCAAHTPSRCRGPTLHQLSCFAISAPGHPHVQLGNAHATTVPSRHNPAKPPSPQPCPCQCCMQLPPET